MRTITDITGQTIHIGNLRKAIRQCKLCLDSPYKMTSGHTVGENNRLMLKQLEKLQMNERRTQN
ncbi:MAG: NADH-quinone oxidoreductase subunit F [Dysgonomonas mossii]|mgnify:CR=1 FL=1|nr:NADH-quinone oxidoreductase subunit F [Dysgonomonas mossii]